MIEDEIIQEVRRARAQLLAECGGTLEGLVAHLRRQERKGLPKQKTQTVSCATSTNAKRTPRQRKK
jgi:hypothetical protein